MAKQPSSKGRSKKLPNYMKRIDPEGNTTGAVSARVDISLKNRFNEAVEVAKRHNIELSITEVIREAMVRACHDVESYTGEQLGQDDLPFDGPSKD
jgi:hypothetical protein